MSYVALSQFDLAENYLSSALNLLIEKNEKSSINIMYYNLGLLYSNKGDSELAIKYLFDGYEDKEKDYKTMFLLAREHFKLGNIKDAQAYIQKGLKVCDTEYMHHFTILKRMVDQSPIEQLEEVIDKALQYFKKENLWKYVKDYAEELANQFFAMNNNKKSSKFFRICYDARQILKWEPLYLEI